MQTMAALDRLLGPLNPNKVAQTTAPTTIRVLVFGASDRQGKSVAEFLIRGGKYIVSAIFEDMDHEFQDGMSDLRGWANDSSKETASQNITRLFGRSTVILALSQGYRCCLPRCQFLALPRYGRWRLRTSWTAVL